MAKTSGVLRIALSQKRNIPSIDTSEPISFQIATLIKVALLDKPNLTTSIKIAPIKDRLNKFASKNGIKIAGDKREKMLVIRLEQKRKVVLRIRNWLLFTNE